MLPFAVVAIVIVYLILDRSGLLNEWLEAFRRAPSRPGPRRQEQLEEQAPEPVNDRRLEVFEQFIEKLESSEEQDD